MGVPGAVAAVSVVAALVSFKAQLRALFTTRKKASNTDPDVIDGECTCTVDVDPNAPTASWVFVDAADEHPEQSWTIGPAGASHGVGAPERRAWGFVRTVGGFLSDYTWDVYDFLADYITVRGVFLALVGAVVVVGSGWGVVNSDTVYQWCTDVATAAVALSQTSEGCFLLIGVPACIVFAAILAASR